MANLYKKYAKADQTNVDGGYKNILWFAPVDTFTLLSLPDPAGATLGAKLTIEDAHTFGVADGFISLLSKKHSVTVKGQSVGDDGAKSMEWTFETTILGDSALLQEELESQLNDNCVYLVKDQDCLNTDGYVQFGDDCLTPVIALEFTGNTTKEGYKEYKLTGTIKKHKYFYTAAVTEKP